MPVTWPYRRFYTVHLDGARQAKPDWLNDARVIVPVDRDFRIPEHKKLSQPAEPVALWSVPVSLGREEGDMYLPRSLGREERLEIRMRGEGEVGDCVRRECHN